MLNTKIIHDTDKTSKMSPFWLRVQTDPTTIKIVELNAMSLPESYRKALELGYNPSVWIQTGSSVEMTIPMSIQVPDTVVF